MNKLRFKEKQTLTESSWIRTWLEQSKGGRLVFPEGDDQRTKTAIRWLISYAELSEIAVITKDPSSQRDYQDLPEVMVYTPESDLEQECRVWLEQHQPKHLERFSEPLWQAGYLVASGRYDSGIAGAVATTADVIRSCLKTIGLQPGIKTLCGGFLMYPQQEAQPLLFADSAVVIEPDKEQLVDIAAASTELWQRLYPQVEPVVAFLSFSTYGSAQHPRAQMMAEAAGRFAVRYPNTLSGGEIQLDAAINPEIGRRKLPESAQPIAGRANIFIFPDLNCGNIAYKLVERLAGYRAFGPLLMGLNQPFSDLSRGCDWQDIASVALLQGAMVGKG